MRRESTGVEASVWDADRMRQSEQTMVEHGLTNYAVAAWHDATGEIAALTEVCTEAETPDWGFQQITAVLPEHRGHRLGLLVKIAMMEHCEPSTNPMSGTSRPSTRTQTTTWSPSTSSSATGSSTCTGTGRSTRQSGPPTQS